MQIQTHSLGKQSGKETLRYKIACLIILFFSIAWCGLIMGMPFLSGGNLFMLLLLTAIASFILGMGMTSIPCYLVLVILVAPALAQMGVVPIAAHLFVFYFGLISFLTPPVAIAAYVACGISGGHPMRTGFIAMRLGVVKYIIPFVFIYNPALLFIGPAGLIVLSVVTGILGVTILSIGLEGYFIQKATLIERILLIGGGFLLLMPVYEYWGLIVGGLILSAIASLWHAKSARKATWGFEVK